jgi:hypothetical protein
MRPIVVFHVIATRKRFLASGYFAMEWTERAVYTLDMAAEMLGTDKGSAANKTLGIGKAELRTDKVAWRGLRERVVRHRPLAKFEKACGQDIVILRSSTLTVAVA